MVNIDPRLPGWLAVLATVVGGACATKLSAPSYRVRADDATSRASKDVWDRFVGECKQRAARVHSVSAEAKIRRVYPKGGLTDVIGAIRKGEEPNYPDREFVFANEFSAWRLDFVNRRVRKETNGAFPVVDASRQPPVQFVQKRELLIFADGKFRSFDLEPADERADHKAPDATFFEGQAHEFVLRDMDRPLCWIAGHFAMHRPRAEEMDVVSFPPSVAELGTLPSQTTAGATDYRFQGVGFKPRTNVVELRVTGEHAPRVVSCSLFAGSIKRWTIDVQYSRGTPEMPTGWSYRAFSATGSLMMEESYQVTAITINDAHADGSIYKHELKKDSTVDVTPENRRYYVADDGSLVTAPHRGRQWLRWPVVGAGIAALLAAGVVFFFGRRRMRVKRPGGERP